MQPLLGLVPLSIGELAGVRSAAAAVEAAQLRQLKTHLESTFTLDQVRACEGRPLPDTWCQLLSESVCPV